jgi:Glycosyl hydrolase catalytic core
MSSKKKGFVYPVNDPTAAAKFAALNVAWYYNWNHVPTANIHANIPYTPMTWSGTSAGDASVMNTLSSNNSTDCILGFNEPDSSHQSNMTVDQAVALWPALVATGRRIGSPATATNATTPGNWFDTFMQHNLKVDFIAIHWYAGPHPDALLNIVDTLHSKYNLPIWITEFAVADWTTANKYTMEQVIAFMKTIIPELESRPHVERYSWKTRTLEDPNMGSSSLFNDDGSLTALGEVYATF